MYVVRNLASYKLCGARVFFSRFWSPLNGIKNKLYWLHNFVDLSVYAMCMLVVPFSCIFFRRLRSIGCLKRFVVISTDNFSACLHRSLPRFLFHSLYFINDLFCFVFIVKLNFKHITRTHTHITK